MSTISLQTNYTHNSAAAAAVATLPPPDLAGITQALNIQYLESNSDRSDSEPTTPRRVIPMPPSDTPSTPVRVFQKAVENLTPERSYMPDERKALDQCATALSQTADTPERKKKARQTKHAISVIAETALGPMGGLLSPSSKSDGDGASAAAAATTPPQKVSPLKPSCIMGMRKDNLQEFFGSGAEEALNKLTPIYLLSRNRSEEPPPVRILNLGHLLEPEKRSNKPVGFHLICEENADLEDQYQVQQIEQNSLTGVWLGSYKVKDMTKKSTFFPRTVTTPEQLLGLLESGLIIAKKDNRQLVRLPEERFYVEMYMRQEYLIQSCFPIFYFAEYTPEVPYQVTDSISLPSRQVFIYGQQGRENSTMFETESDLIIDIAPQIPNCPLPKGIYISFPKELFSPLAAASAAE